MALRQYEDISDVASDMSSPRSSMDEPPPSSNSLELSPHHKHIWIVTGPAGCGKSTVGKLLSDALSYPYIEGDEYHPPSNVAKMASGIPLNDADRWDWLIHLRDAALDVLSPSAATSNKATSSIPSAKALPSPPNGVIVTCSALKRKYRDVIRTACYFNPLIRVHFVYLRASEKLLLQRVRQRQGHYMKEGMVKSQFQELEEPDEDEKSMDCVVVGVERREVNEVQKMALARVQAVLAAD
ncbi:MAG: hypothetical protein M1819_000217 [Sarea resinae]|nr:MAG: hypothetical protein M1819_000217 [Sarea resinae]